MLLQYSANQWPWQAILNYLKDDYLVCVLITILSFFQSPLEQKKRRTLPCYYILNLVRFELKIMVKMRYLHQWCIWHLYTFHIYYFYVVVVLQSLSHIQLFATPWTAAHQAPMSTTISWNLLKFMSMESVMLSNHLILCHSPSLFAFSLSQNQDQGLFRWVGSSHQFAKVLELRHQSFQLIFRVGLL